jgi:hypothetical protein
MKINRKFIFIPVLCIFTISCVLSDLAQVQEENPPIPVNTIIALTYSASLTETATTSARELQPVELTSTPFLTETPALPQSYVYEGESQSCVCDHCVCISNITFSASITMGPDGHVTGEFDQKPDKLLLKFEGTKENLHGLQQLGRDKATGIEEETDEFIGSLNNNLSMLTCTITSVGKYSGYNFSAKRTFILFKK